MYFTPLCDLHLINFHSYCFQVVLCLNSSPFLPFIETTVLACCKTYSGKLKSISNKNT